MTAKIKLNAASGGGSISIQAPSSSSNNRVITLPDIADGTLLTNQTAGTVLQVVSATKTDTLTTTSTSGVDVLTAAITPSSSSNKILIQATSQFALKNNYGYLTLRRDSTDIFIGDASSNRKRVTFGSFHNNDSHYSYYVRNFHASFLDSPSSTSAITYRLRAEVESQTMYINRTIGDDNQTYEPRQATSLILMEVSA